MNNLTQALIDFPFSRLHSKSSKGWSYNELLGVGSQWRIQDFPQEGTPSPEGGRQPIIWPIFPKNCMKMKKFRAGGTSLAPPLDPPLGLV